MVIVEETPKQVLEREREQQTAEADIQTGQHSVEVGFIVMSCTVEVIILGERVLGKQSVPAKTVFDVLQSRWLEILWKLVKFCFDILELVDSEEILMNLSRENVGTSELTLLTEISACLEVFEKYAF